ncbi:hypothetical protein B0O80DRAFT_453197 [Mortierella sp. GBAus27b]|nr:hypothetical protein B0O80DRAFT_453197 [Mortierella sp. GBAus27b]
MTDHLCSLLSCCRSYLSYFMTRRAFHHAGSPMDQDLSSQQAQQQQQVTSPIKREHSSFSANSSPKTDRASYYSTQQLYTSQDQPQQVWVASIADDIHTQQEFLNQERQQHHQRSYSQSSKGYHSPQASVVSQQSTLPAISGLPLLSPTNMFQPDSQPSSYPMGMHDTPTVMSHDYGRVMSSVAVDDGSHYNSMAHKKNRTSSVGSQCDYDGRPRAGSVNSTTSSIASSCAISSLATTFGSTVIGSSFPAQLMEENEEEEEDSDSPTTIQMRPRNNSAPRRATAVRAFTCSVIGCTKAYTQLHNLKSHERTGHTPVIKLKPFTCIVGDCKKAFSQRKSLALHIKAAHAEFKFKPFKCSQPGCTKSYTQLHNLRTHEKTVHLVDLSRKRIKNPSNTTTHCMTSSGQGLATPAGFGLDTTKHHGQQMGYQQHGGHMDGGAHSGLGLAYDPIDMASLSHHGDGGAYHYQPRQHEQPEPQQQHHHHHQQQQQYARLPHMSALPMYDHRA